MSAPSRASLATPVAVVETGRQPQGPSGERATMPSTSHAAPDGAEPAVEGSSTSSADTHQAEAADISSAEPLLPDTATMCPPSTLPTPHKQPSSTTSEGRKAKSKSPSSPSKATSALMALPLLAAGAAALWVLRKRATRGARPAAVSKKAPAQKQGVQTPPKALRGRGRPAATPADTQGADAATAAETEAAPTEPEEIPDPDSLPVLVSELPALPPPPAPPAPLAAPPLMGMVSGMLGVCVCVCVHVRVCERVSERERERWGRGGVSSGCWDGGMGLH